MFPSRSCLATSLLILISVLCNGAAAQDPFIAGLAPYERPPGAPTVSAAAPETTRAQWATRGISQPVPQNVQAFLKDQGGWYTPFSYPGMTGGYDIRGWHPFSVSQEKR